MAEERIVETPATHTTVIERSGGGAGWLIAIILLAAVVIGGFFLLNQSRNDNAKTEAVTSAAKSVGDTADKVGDAVTPGK
ncbi:MAG: hypothetical protein OSB00_07220 [Sphingomonas bacterium]|nr:hypothetical protein [Sphingomonas bacterium]